jgi:hypothetical protein
MLRRYLSMAQTASVGFVAVYEWPRAITASPGSVSLWTPYFFTGVSERKNYCVCEESRAERVRDVFKRHRS